MCKWALGAMMIGAAPLVGGDLKSIERKIGKEPAYQGKPRYCLLVFGPEAKSRLWLALDGEKLYVDRNGNGDLTDDGAAVEAKIEGEGERVSRSFVLADFEEGGRKHKQLYVYTSSLKAMADRDSDARELLKRDPEARSYGVSADIDFPGHKGNGLGERVVQTASFRDVAGYLQFAESPRDAPIIHFAGPLAITLYSKDKMTIGRNEELVLSVGTRGLGRGTTAYVGYEGLIPEGLNPKAEIEFPAKTSGEPPIKEQFELKERC